MRATSLTELLTEYQCVTSECALRLEKLTELVYSLLGDFLRSVQSKSLDNSEVKSKRTVAKLGLRIKKKRKEERAGTLISVK